MKTMVFTSPTRWESHAATGNESALNRLAQKKKTLAADNERWNRSNSHSASSDCTMKPPAKELRAE